MPTIGCSMNKICILTIVHHTFDTRIFHKQAKTLTKAGYDVTLIAQHDKDEVVDGIKIIALPKPKNRFWRMLGIWRVFKLACQQKANMYHFHDPELIPIAILLKITRRTKIIYDVHEDVPNQILAKEYIPNYLRWFISKVIALIERIALPLFDVVIVASADIIWHLPQSPKAVVIRNFASLEIVRRIRSEQSSKDKGQPAMLIHIGGISKGRGVKQMVEAVNRLENKAKLILVGAFSDSRLKNEVQARAGTNVEFVGQVPYERIPFFLGKADIGLICFRPDPNNLASAWRNNKLFEYMAAGLPVITSNFQVWKEIVEGNNCGLTVDPLNPEDIARAMKHLLEHPDKARQMGENGRKAVLEKYNWENESKKLLALYEELLKQ